MTPTSIAQGVVQTHVSDGRSRGSNKAFDDVEGGFDGILNDMSDGATSPKTTVATIAMRVAGSVPRSEVTTTGEETSVFSSLLSSSAKDGNVTKKDGDTSQDDGTQSSTNPTGINDLSRMVAAVTAAIPPATSGLDTASGTSTPAQSLTARGALGSTADNDSTALLSTGSTTSSEATTATTTQSVFISDVAVQTHLVTQPSTSISSKMLSGSSKTATGVSTPVAFAVSGTGSVATSGVSTAEVQADTEETTGGKSTPLDADGRSDKPARTLNEEPITTTAADVSTAAANPAVQVVVPASTSPTQAVATAITTSIDRQHSASTQSEPLATSTIAPPRTLTLQLTPANMGTISVTMHAAGHTLDLQLAVSEKDTLGTISRERDTLSKAVLEQGYDLRSLVIQDQDNAAAPSSGGNREAQSGQADAQTQSGTDRQPPRSGRDDQRPTQDARTTSDENSRAASRPRADDLFV